MDDDHPSDFPDAGEPDPSADELGHPEVDGGGLAGGYDIYDPAAEKAARAEREDDLDEYSNDEDDLIEELFDDIDDDDDFSDDEDETSGEDSAKYELTVQQLVDAELAEKRYFDYLDKRDVADAASARSRYKIFIAGALAACSIMGYGVYEMVDEDTSPAPALTCAQQIEKAKDAHAQRIIEAVQSGTTAPEYQPPSCAPEPR